MLHRNNNICLVVLINKISNWFIIVWQYSLLFYVIILDNILPIRIFEQTIFHMITPTQMFLLILCIFLIRKISKKLTIYIKSIRILKDIRKNTDDNIVQGDCLLLFKSLLNEYFGNILLWMILVETSYKRIGTMQIHHKFMLLPYQISFFQRILKGLFHLRV